MGIKINFDSGIKEYDVNGSTLRMNPSDPNLYARFFEAQDRLEAIEAELVERGKTIRQPAEGAPQEETIESGRQIIMLMKDADGKVKALLNAVFPGNDFDEILAGVNTMAVGDNGERVITNLFNALVPIIEEGARAYAEDKGNAAVLTAKANRAQRRAAAKRK